MEKTYQRTLEIKHKMILLQERSWAHSLARAMIKPGPISVWEVLIPVLLIFGYAKSKSEREITIKNLLFTKELALDAALKIIRDCRNKEEVLSLIRDKTRKLIKTVGNDIYSEEIRQEQLKEIHLLIAHYCRLLKAEGKDYDSLVMNTYLGRESFMDFLSQLREAEKGVNLAALKILGHRGDPELVSRMEDLLDQVRIAAAQRIFKKADP